MKTSEYHDPIINDNFRVYKNKSESLNDYVKFLCDNKRYREHRFFSISNYTEQAQALENAGYSTVKDKNGNKTYADLLIKIIRENNLQLIDHDAQMKKCNMF